MVLSMGMNLLFCTASMLQKTLNFPYDSYAPFDLKLKSLNSLRVLQSFALKNKIYEF